LARGGGASSRNTQAENGERRATDGAVLWENERNGHSGCGGANRKNSEPAAGKNLAPTKSHSGALRETARPTNPSAFKEIRKWAGPDCAREELESRMNQKQKSTRNPKILKTKNQPD
jgi:hypothetical protein